MPVTKKRLHNVGTQTMSTDTTQIFQLTQILPKQQYQFNCSTHVDNTAWRTRNIFDLPDSDVEHNRPLPTSMLVLPQLQLKNTEALTIVAPNQGKQNLEDVDYVSTKRRRVPLNNLHSQKLNLASPVIPVKTLENDLVVTIAFLFRKTSIDYRTDCHKTRHNIDQ